MFLIDPVNVGLVIGLSVPAVIIFVFIVIGCSVFCCGAKKCGEFSPSSHIRRSTPTDVVATTAHTSITHEEQQTNFGAPTPNFGLPVQEPPSALLAAYPASGYEPPPPYAMTPPTGAYVPESSGYPSHVC